MNLEPYEMFPQFEPDWDDVVKMGWGILGIATTVIALLVLGTKCCS